MNAIEIVKHAPGAPGLRILGLGAKGRLVKGLEQLKKLLDEEAFWASGRDYSSLRKMLFNSTEIISIWEKDCLIGFGRATSDRIFRAVLWDIVVKSEFKGVGIGKLIVENLINKKSIKNVEKIYLMTTTKSSFYTKFGFKKENKQTLMLLSKDKKLINVL
ncbi:putative acetyltransferase, GNAT family [Prochlorococcus marinus str. NATL1A]|uniref:Putative acetyltransferase, GNAT family n=1 Tax=Prochlorococcus marinus (strain NATL1A) TaxID=167555 RepID=A2C5A6_PROM1|nr:GNAT family N-acetyltransferase [Prochlorococcus marinus]ABM76666.1 putative acetyltransferase, GNAT family [Prochlorococcus marinus str. NATL1A]